ncbi:hypothetical protein O181_128828 [Austropuccinia psidii MF-1]|uniref:Uncharacterized protein n=1 Tax=Austropuccinia psidii MF-1 TaxID=1389203 RepID=A0A9Q3Q894_9BASI|nr:hypothetical protein [Austropuccinia psidii MF-1]
MVRQENIETASTATGIIPASTLISSHNRTVIITQNNQQGPIWKELINLKISNTLHKAQNLANRARYKPSSSSQKGHRCYYGRRQSDTEGKGSVKHFHNNKLSNSQADDTILASRRANTTTRSLSAHLQSQPEGLQQCTAAQRVPDLCRSVEKLHEIIPDCKKIPGSSQHLQVTQFMASIDGNNNMMHLTAGWRKNNLSQPKKVPIPAAEITT